MFKTDDSSDRKVWFLIGFRTNIFYHNTYRP